MCFEEVNELFFIYYFCEVVLMWYIKSFFLFFFEGVRYDDFYLKVVEVLFKVEVFFYVVGFDKEFLFKDFYDIVLKEVRKRCNEDDEWKLLIFKFFY